MNRRPLALNDLLSIKGVSDSQLSPDGLQIAFVVESVDADANQSRSRLWIVDADGPAQPRPLTGPESHDSQPRWSPDGRTVAFVSNRGGSRQVWLLPLAGGDPRQLTSHPVAAREPVWSPDGSRLAFLAAGPDHRGDSLQPDDKDDRTRLVWVRAHRHKLDGQGFFSSLRTHLWITPLDGGDAEQVTDGPFDDASPAWSPGGHDLAFTSDRSAERDAHFDGGSVHVVNLATRALRRLTPETGRAAHPSWSPDGQWIAYVGTDAADDASPAPTHLWIVGANGENARCLTAALDQSVGQRPGGYLTPSPPAWTPDGASLLYLVGDGPSTRLCRVPTGTGPHPPPRSIGDGAGSPDSPSPSAMERQRRGEARPDLSQALYTPLTAGRCTVQSFSVDRQAHRAALLIASATAPAEVWLWDGEQDEAASVRQRTELNGALLAAVALATPEDLRISRPDGTVVEGWLLRPTVATAAKVPLILSIHGGPHNYFGDTFSFDHQLFAALGYAVLYGNPRGSGGSTESFARAVCEDWGGADFHDLLALLDHAIERADPPIDTARLGITGSSYGGFMTCWAITQTRRFAAAVAGASISNLVSFFGTSDIGASWGTREFGGTPFERLDWYLGRSPLQHAAQVDTPLLLYHGEADLRCPIEQSEQFFTALHRLGKSVEFVRVPTESHGVLNGSPRHRLSARQAILDWFGRFL